MLKTSMLAAWWKLADLSWNSRLPFVSAAGINEQLSATCLIRPISSRLFTKSQLATLNRPPSRPSWSSSIARYLLYPMEQGERALLPLCVGEFALSRGFADDILRGSPAGVARRSREEFRRPRSLRWQFPWKFVPRKSSGNHRLSRLSRYRLIF